MEKITIKDFSKYMENSFNMCNFCNIPLVMKYPRPGQTWKAFPSCPNYKAHPDYKPKPTNDSSPQPLQSPTAQVNKVDPNILLADEIASLRADFNKRMDEMASYLKSKLS